MSLKAILSSLINWICGILFSAIGIINVFWGNDPQFGIFIIFLSLVFFPPINHFLIKRTKFYIPIWLKIIIGIFILWASLGVGELADKVDMMRASFGIK